MKKEIRAEQTRVIISTMGQKPEGEEEMDAGEEVRLPGG